MTCVPVFRNDAACSLLRRKEAFLILIDYNDKHPIYEQIVNRFEALIISGALEPDEKLPSVRSLAVELSINPNTIQRAYAELERRGYIYTVIGRGNFVKNDSALAEIQLQKNLKDLRLLLISCKESGVRREEILSCIDSIYINSKEETK